MKFTKLDKKRVFSPLEKRIAWDSNLFANKGGSFAAYAKRR